MKKVMFVTQTMTFGGAEKVIATLANSFVNMNIESTIVTVLNVQSQFVLDERIGRVCLYEGEGRPSIKDYPTCYKKLRRMIIAKKPDCVVIMPEEISCKALVFLQRLDTRIVVSERNNPWVMPKNKLNRILRRLYYPTVDGVVFQTGQAATFFSKKIRKKSMVILNPLDISRLPERYTGIRRDVIVTMGRLEPQKNHRMLIDAFARFVKEKPEYKLEIYGNGSLKEELAEYADSIELKDSVIMCGACDDVLLKVNDAKMFVMSSDYEGLPNALIEAMAAGLACISTDCPSGGPKELITDGTDGILVPVNDACILAKRMLELAESDEYIKKLGDNATMIIERLRPEKIVREWAEYLRLIE